MSGRFKGVGADLNTVAEAMLSFNRWSKEALPVANSIIAMDVLLGVYLAERKGRQPATFKDLCWDLRYSEQAIRTIVDGLGEAQWVTLEQDKRFRRPISRLRIPPDQGRRSGGRTEATARFAWLGKLRPLATKLES
jgi:hypothetical protein